MIHLILPGKVDTAPAVKTFLRAYAYQKAGTDSIFLLMQPFGKIHLELVIPHRILIEWETFHRQMVFRHFPHPDVLHCRIPRTPIVLMHGRTGGYVEGYTNPIYFQNIFVVFQDTVHVINGHTVLDFIIHVVDTDFPFQPVPTDVVDTQVKQHAAILSSRKGNANIIELLEDNIQTLLCQFIHILLKRLHFYFSLIIFT